MLNESRIPEGYMQNAQGCLVPRAMIRPRENCGIFRIEKCPPARDVKIVKVITRDMCS